MLSSEGCYEFVATNIQGDYIVVLYTGPQPVNDCELRQGAIYN